MAARHRTSSDELEQRILDAALGQLTEVGLSGLTVRGIATRAQVAPMGLYNHFAGKDGVLDALWIQGFDLLSSTMGEALALEEPIDALNACGRLYREFALAHPQHYRLMFLEHLGSFKPSPQASEVAGRAFLVLVTLVERCQREGYFAPGPPITLAQLIWASVHGFVALELLGLNFAEQPSETFEQLKTALISGLLQPR